VLKPDPAVPNGSNKALKVLDISYNPISKVAIKHIASMMETNRTLEYLGVAKCHLENEDIVEIFNMVGRIPFPQD
jgi:Ran GTPase-activating protein (RanGAP) involved in mRNA processing and transport